MLTISHTLTVEHICAHFVKVLECDCDGVYVASLVVLQSMLLEHSLYAGRDSRVSELRHGWEHVVLDL